MNNSEYLLLNSPNPTMLQDMVTAYLRKGYHAVGAPFIHNNSYYQAVEYVAPFIHNNSYYQAVEYVAPPDWSLMPIVSKVPDTIAVTKDW